MAVRGATEFLSLLFSSPELYPALLLRAYDTILGVVVVLLECRSFLCTLRTRKKTAELAKALTYLAGRGVLYAFIGGLLALQYPEVVDLTMAAYMSCLGFMSVLFGLSAQRRLAHLSTTMTEDEKIFKEKFDKYDEEGLGTVSTAQVATICAELGSRLSHHELEAAVLSLDVSMVALDCLDDGVASVHAPPYIGHGKWWAVVMTVCLCARWSLCV